MFTYSSRDIYGRFFHIVDCDEYVHHQATFIIVNIAVSLTKTHGHSPSTAPSQGEQAPDKNPSFIPNDPHVIL